MADSNYVNMGHAGKLEYAEVWKTTSELRWAYGRDDAEPVLQQAWYSNKGNVRWDDVPSVRLPSPSQTSSQHSDKE